MPITKRRLPDIAGSPADVDIEEDWEFYGAIEAVAGESAGVLAQAAPPEKLEPGPRASLPRRGRRKAATTEEGNQAQINRAFKNIELTRQRMANDQIEIDRLRTETRQMIAELLK